MTRLVAVLLCVCGSVAAAQVHEGDGPDRVGFIGPLGEVQYLPSGVEMAARAQRGTEYSAFAEYAQRRIELLGLVSEVVYVDDDAPVGGDGTSWQTAHQSLQDALAADYSDRLVEIRMAQGTYRTDRFGGVNTMDREASFTPRFEDANDPAGVFRIVGGYAGLGAAKPDQRDAELFPTIITGDLNGDDGPDFTNYDDNTLVLFDDFNSELHGLVIEHAQQAMVGSGSLTIDGCLVRYHAGSETRGAGTFSGGVLVVKRSTFFRNRSGQTGGALWVPGPHNALVSNKFLSNEASAMGGAVSMNTSSPSLLIMQNNYFAGNAVSWEDGSFGGAVAVFQPPVSACNTVVFNRSEDGHGGGFGRLSWFLADHYNIFDLFHMNAGDSGHGLHEQFPSLPLWRELESVTGNPRHFIRGSFVQDWESSESNRPGSYAHSRDTIRDNSGEEVLFVDLAGPDGIIGTLDDDPTPRPDSPNIDRFVDLEGAEFALLDFADLNDNGIVDELLPYDLLGYPRFINTPGVGHPDGGIDAGAIEYAGDPARFDYSRPMSGRRIDPMDGCEGDEPIRLFVNASGPISGDGSSWDSPLLELYEALDVARSRCGPVEIWLAAGTYLPDFSVPVRRASFRPTNNVTILGGFAGWEDNADQRDPETNVSILSGDRFGDDDPEDLDTLLDNAYRVVVATGERGGGVIDGVTIKGGVARATRYAGWIGSLCAQPGPYSTGAAVTVASGEVTLVDCTVSACGATYGVACATTGTGTLRIRNLQVLDDQFPIGCPQSRSQVYAPGIDSILARPTSIVLEEVALQPTTNTTPFGGFFTGNASVSITRSKVDFGARSEGSFVGSGFVSVRLFEAESSLLSRLQEIKSSSTFINQCTLPWGPSLQILPQPNASHEEQLIVSNSIVMIALLAYEELLPISQAFHCIYNATNFTTRVDEIILPAFALDTVFVDLYGPDGDARTPDGDYRLAFGSPAVDSGSNELVASKIDLDGNPRIVGLAVDRGAYELQQPCAPDLNGDGVIDLDDLDMVLRFFGTASADADINGDGIVDMDDLSIVLLLFGQDCFTLSR